MCMGYAKDIKIWVCAQELSAREHSLERWGALICDASEPPPAISLAESPKPLALNASIALTAGIMGASA